MRGSPHAHMLLWVQPHKELCAEKIHGFIVYVGNINAANISGDSAKSDLVKKYQRHQLQTQPRKRKKYLSEETF